MDYYVDTPKRKLITSLMIKRHLPLFLTVFFSCSIWVYAGLPKKTIGDNYSDPWNWIENQIKNCQPFQPKHCLELKPNQAVTRAIFNIPSKYQARLNQRVIRLDIIHIQEPQEPGKRIGTETTDLILVNHFENGSHQLALSSDTGFPDKTLFNTFSEYLVALFSTKAEFENASFYSNMNPETGERNVVKFTFNTDKPYAKEEMNSFYEKCPKFIFDSLISEIRNTPELNNKVSAGIKLIFLGCGTGGEVIVGQKAVKRALAASVHCHGFDIEPQAIQKANEKYSNYLDTCSFSTGDALEANSIIEKTLGENDTDGVVIVIAIGLISEGILQGTYPALTILQQIAQSQRVDRIFEARYGAHLYTHDTAEASGWLLQYKAIPEKILRDKPSENPLNPQTLTEAIYIMSPISIEDQAKACIARSSYRSDLLDLSLTSHPSLIFEKVKQNHQQHHFNVVDLSWSHIERENLQPFLHKLKEMNITTIIFSGFEPWYDEARSITNTMSVAIEKRTDSERQHELPSLLPPLARQIWKDYQVSVPVE